MSTYKEIRGLKVRDYTTNPDNPIEGQVWYNTTANTARYQIPNRLASWRTANNSGSTKDNRAGAGTQTAGLVFAGGPAGSPVTETYDGTSFTEVGEMNTGRSAGGDGSQTSALAWGGYSTTAYTALTESWNGSAWTEVNDLNTSRYSVKGFGADNTNAIAIGGTQGPSPLTITEQWNGSSWTEVNDLNTARSDMGGFGIYTAG